MTEHETEARSKAAQPASSGFGLVRWCVEGGRTALLMSPQWQGLRAAPLVIAALMAAIFGLLVLVERLYIVGPADFYWKAIASGWFSSALLAWVCYLMRPAPLRGSP
ncbi:MAG: hypothetical protein JWM42_1943, partial [Burkholderia sp.]|nr:hypothetical protein [Burkholderia sp.]